MQYNHFCKPLDTFINHWIWLDDSLPLILLTELSNHFFVILQVRETLIVHYAK